MAGPPDLTSSLPAIHFALGAGTEVEDLLEAAIPRAIDSGSSSPLARITDSLWSRPHAPPNPTGERLRRIADGLDAFSAELSDLAALFDDPELWAIAERSRRWGPALWSSEIGVDHAYNEVRHALVELCRRRANLVIGRPLSG
ncbi:MAG: hypothetical protein ACR2P0_06415 [Acidimicrobiales bacterium]